MKQIGYYFKEVTYLLKLNLLTNVLSLISTTLILFILAIVISGWWGSSQLTDALKKEAQISLYFNENITNDELIIQSESIKDVDGVLGVRIISNEEAYERMEKILGDEAQVLSYFDENPFSAYIEVNIDLEKRSEILSQLKQNQSIKHIRDNQDVLTRLSQIIRLFNLLGFLIITAVAVSTLVIISHMIRQSVEHNKEQIHTLKYLGASSAFIDIPYYLTGLIITIFGGGIATIFSVIVIKQIYNQINGPLPFIAMPSVNILISNLCIIMLLISLIIALIGSVFGLKTSKKST